MAELTNLETKLAEVMGLAMAAKEATRKVHGLVSEPEIKQRLTQMSAEAQETQQRCATLAGEFDGKKTAITEEARSTKSKAAEMMAIYLDEDADALDGFEFMTMAEAGEVGHWAVLGKLGENAPHVGVKELVQWALPIQERHLAEAQRISLNLAGKEDPHETA